MREEDTMEFTRKRTGMLNFTFITVLMFSCEVLVSQRNILKFCYGVNYRFEGQQSHYIDRYYVF